MKEAETRAGEALRELLEKIPILHVEGIDAEAVSGDWEPDLIARLLVEGRPHQLICEFKSNGQPRYARAALLELRNYVAHRAVGVDGAAARGEVQTPVVAARADAALCQRPADRA